VDNLCGYAGQINRIDAIVLAQRVATTVRSYRKKHRSIVLCGHLILSQPTDFVLDVLFDLNDDETPHIAVGDFEQELFHFRLGASSEERCRVGT
jgi:D-serine deaminase-like pyridoxal phosphate-dependent protein